MANPSTTHVIEIESGIGEPAFIPLSMGHELQPISIGKKGMWRVDGARVLDVHAFVYFDGSSLFLQSADESAAAIVDGCRIGKAWTELHAPCRIEVGAARLRYRSLLPEPFQKPDRPFKPGAFATIDDESTRRAPLESTAGARLPSEDETPSTKPRAPTPRPGGAPMQQPPAYPSGAYARPPPRPPVLVPAQGSMPPQQPMAMPMPGGPQPFGSGAYPQQQQPQHSYPGALGGYPVQQPQGSLPPGGYGSMTPAQREPQGLERLVTQFKAMSPPKQIGVILLPIAVFLAVWSLWDEYKPQPRSKHPVAAADAGAGPKATQAPATSGGPPVSSTAIAWPPNVPCPPPGWPANQPLPCIPNGVAPPAAATQVVTPVDTAPPHATKDAGAKEPKDAGAPPPAGAKSLQRQAVDAVAAGDYAKAASLYEELARQDPNSSVVFGEAARILRARMDGGAP